MDFNNVLLLFSCNFRSSFLRIFEIAKQSGSQLITDWYQPKTYFTFLYKFFLCISRYTYITLPFVPYTQNEDTHTMMWEKTAEFHLSSSENPKEAN